MSLGLKLYYLRSKVKRVTQTTMSKELGVRQATISNIEQGVSEPSLPLLRQLCRYFDVTPTYLLDDDGPLETTAADRWRNRHGLASTGQFVEVPDHAVHRLDGSVLVALLPGTAIYDEDAARARTQGAAEDLTQAHRRELARRRRASKALRAELDAERDASRARRRGHKGREAGS